MDIQKIAKKRIKAKRYLAILGYSVPNNSISTKCLVTICRAVRAEQKVTNNAWPLTGAAIETLAKENHYLNQLVSMKRMFGINSSIHVVFPEPGFGRRMATVADLIKAGLTPAKYARIDDNWDRLELIGASKRAA